MHRKKKTNKTNSYVNNWKYKYKCCNSDVTEAIYGWWQKYLSLHKIHPKLLLRLIENNFKVLKAVFTVRSEKLYCYFYRTITAETVEDWDSTNISLTCYPTLICVCKILISEFSTTQHYVGAYTVSSWPTEVVARAATFGWASADLIHCG